MLKILLKGKTGEQGNEELKAVRVLLPHRRGRIRARKGGRAKSLMQSQVLKHWKIKGQTRPFHFSLSPSSLTNNIRQISKHSKTSAEWMKGVNSQNCFQRNSWHQ